MKEQIYSSRIWCREQSSVAFHTNCHLSADLHSQQEAPAPPSTLSSPDGSSDSASLTSEPNVCLVLKGLRFLLQNGPILEVKSVEARKTDRSSSSSLWFLAQLHRFWFCFAFSTSCSFTPLDCLPWNVRLQYQTQQLPQLFYKIKSLQ